MSEFWGDIRFGLRLLARSPIFALTVALLLGIGIGANTLIFSILDTLLLRPLPVKHAEQLVRLVEVHPTGFMTWDLPYVLYEQLASHAFGLTEILCQGNLDVALEDGSATERIRVNTVSGNFFSELGVGAHLGRVLTPVDEKAGNLYAVISYDFWKRRWAGSASIVGRNVRLNGRAFTVIGMLPKGANGLTVDTSPDIRIPTSAGRLLAEKPEMDAASVYFLRQFQIFGHLRPGIALAQAEAEVESLLQRPYEEAQLHAFPELAKSSGKDFFDSRFRLEPMPNGVSSLRAQFKPGLILLMACVGLLLLMACGNVACLLLARSEVRSQEIGIRLALGANPGRIVRQLLTESLVLALSGCALGVLLTYACRPLLLAAFPPIRDRSAVLQPLAIHIDIDLRVLGFAIAASLLTAILFGLLPAIQGARQDLASFLRASRTSTARLSSRNILVMAQVAICVLLLIGAGLLVETFDRMRAMNPGFDRDHIVTFSIDPGLKGYRPERAKIFSRQLLAKVGKLPGVVAASIASRGLMRGTGVKGTFGAAGATIGKNDFLNSSLNSVTPGYFDTMGMRVIAGRDFTWSDDDKQKPQRVIVNQAFARRFFSGRNALGRLFGGRGPDGLAAPANQIVGVVSDAKYRSLREDVPPIVYSPVVNGFGADFILHIRTRAQPESAIPLVRESLRSLDPQLPFIEVRTLRDEVETSLWQERLLAWLSTIFTGFAAFLAGIGLYGALDLAVKSRTKEIGVRAALGADPLRIVQWFSKEALWLVFVGTASGLAVYAASMRWIRQVLYGVTALDPIALGLALLFVTAIAILSIAAPIWRAARIDPATALRHE